MADGAITASLQVATDAAGNTFTPVAAGNSATLDQDVTEQATLSFADTLIGAAGATAVHFSVDGLAPDDSGTITFSDAANNTKTVDIVNGTPVSATVDLSGFTDGTVTASLSASDAAGNTFTADSSNTATLDQDNGEQAALSLSFVDTTILTAHANAVHFTVGGLDAEDSAVVTFRDSLGSTTTKTVSANGTATVDLSGLADGAITASLQVATDAAGNTFTPVAASNSATLDQDATEQAVDDPFASTVSTPEGLPDFQGSISGTIPVALNNAGQISGTYVDASGITHGFLYSGSTYTTIDDPLAGTFGTAVRAINDTGQIVGYYITNGTITDGHSFLYRGSTYTALDIPGARDGSATFAFGLNNAGNVVGYYVNSQQDSYGFLYTGGTYTTLADPSAYAGGISTHAFSINNAGQIVGDYQDLAGPFPRLPLHRRHLHHYKRPLRHRHPCHRDQRCGPDRWLVHGQQRPRSRLSR